MEKLDALIAKWRERQDVLGGLASSATRLCADELAPIAAEIHAEITRLRAELAEASICPHEGEGRCPLITPMSEHAPDCDFSTGKHARGSWDDLELPGDCTCGASAHSPAAASEKDVCKACGHYRETHHANRCDGWMPAGTGHHKTTCDCAAFESRAAASGVTLEEVIGV